MGFNPFNLFLPKRMVGVDIGTSSIKIVEISKWGGGRTLENYGEMKSASFFRDSSSQTGSNLLSAGFISKAMKAILDEARIKTKAAIFSIPDYSTFFVSFDLPPLTEKEVSEAVRFNAPQYVPLPISETTLDWKIISGTPGNKQPMKVLVAAVANQIVQEYQRIAQMAGLQLYALEAEALSIVRALVKDNKMTICLLDIGTQSTTVNIIEHGVLKKSHSLDFSTGGQMTYSIASALDKSYTEAEDIKIKDGLLSSNENIKNTLYLQVDPLLTEVKKIISEYSQYEQKEVQEIYLAGGTANLPGLKEYFAEALDRKVQIPNCFSDFLTAPILEETLAEMSPRFCVAVGVALSGLK
ncbi:type IV pilus assembly protein PilM [Patescibacteria group bacterium]|nr:type IV pilus assembly protein PilM [Patescibacteria group bacterium]